MKKVFYICLALLTIMFSSWLNVAVAQNVNIPDANLEAAVRNALRKKSGTLTQADMKRLTQLYVGNRGIISLTGLEHAVNLKGLGLWSNEISDISPIANLKNLTYLNVSNNQISDIKPLAGLKNLTNLYLDRNAISNIKPLEGLKNLTDLFFGYNKISDIKSIANLRNLTRLGLWAITTSDVGPLANLKNLTYLHLGGNAISNIKPLVELRNLTTLYLWDNKISDVAPLKDLKNLTQLGLNGNAISNIKPLAELRNLTALYLWNNKISDVAPLKDLKNLTELVLNGNAIKDVSPLAGLQNLTKLWLRWNSISSVKPLANLRNLEVLDLRDNQIRSVRSLEGLRNLDRLFLNSNPITVNVPLTLTKPMPLDRGQFVVFSRDRDRSIAGKVKIIYQNWQAFINANPVITKPPKESEDQGGFGGLLERVNETLDNFRTEGFGGTLELIAHPETKLTFGDLVISEIMWGRHGTPADNQWVELYTPRKRITLNTNRYALLFTGTYLDRNVIPKTEHYAGWRVIDRVRNASTRSQVSWRLPGLSRGTLRDQPPVSMRREISYETGNVPNGSLADSWSASSNQENLSTGYGSPGDRGVPTVFIPALQRPPLYWIDADSGRLQRLTDAQVKNIAATTENVTSFAIDTANGKVYWTEKTSNATGKIHRANLNGSEVEEWKSFSANVPLSIAVDSNGNKLYWTNSRGKIQQSNLNGKSVKALLQNLNSPTAIDLDVAGGKIYWTEPGSIWRANLNGKNKEELITGLQEVGSIAIADSHIYWTEKIGTELNAVKRANLDGTNPEEIISIENVAFKDIAVDSVGKKLYWTDSRGRIRRANLNGSRIQNVVTGLAPHTYLALNILSPEDATERKNPSTPVLNDVKVLVPASQRPPLYWIDADSGRLQHLTDAQAENVGISTQNVTDLTVDTINGKVYWTEKSGNTAGKIHRANLDGSEVKALISLSGSVPLSIAVDNKNNKLYWTNSRGKIQRSNLSGKSVKALLQNLNSPTAIDLDVAGGKIYWTESGSIWRVNLNGKNKEELVPGLQEVGSITIANSHIYWTEKIGRELEAVKRANLDGTNSEAIILIRNVAFKDITVDSVGKKLYWTDSRGRIRRANLNGLRIQNVATGLATPTHIALKAVVPENPAAPSSTSLALLQSPAGTAPEETNLLSNYPNPFNPETWIPYQLATDTNVQILIYDTRGTIVRRLELGYQPRGYYTGRSRAAYWDGRNGLGEPVASGIYFYQLQADEVSLMRKMVIRK